MKKKCPGTLLLLSVLIFSLTGCGTSAAGSQINDATEASAVPDTTETSVTAVSEAGIVPEEISDETVASKTSSDSSVSSKTSSSDSSKKADNSQSGTAGTQSTIPAGHVVYLIFPSEDGISVRERDTIKSELEADGCAVVTKNYEHDVSKQTAAFNEAITAQAGAIICDNIDEEATLASVQSAKASGIPTFLLDRGISVTGVASAQILTDRFSCVASLTQIFRDSRSRKTICVELAGSTEDSRSQDVMAAFDDIVSADEEDIKVVARDVQASYDSEDAKSKIRTLLAANPQANALVCYNEQQTQAGLTVIGEIGRTDISVLCIYGDGDHIEDLINSGQVIGAIVKPAETLGKTAAKEVMTLLDNGSTGENECQYVTADIITAQGIPSTVRK